MTCKPSLPDLKTAFATELAHLIRMAKNPGWKAHAWHRAKELDADQSGLFTGMAEALKTAMNGPATQSASEGQSRGKSL